MKKKTKKLVLAKETVKSLKERQGNLKDAAGGVYPAESVALPCTVVGCWTGVCYGN